MKSLREFIIENKNISEAYETDPAKVEACNKEYGSKWIKLHEQCKKFAWDPNFSRNKRIDNTELDDFFDENDNKFSDLVKAKIEFALALDTKNISKLEEIHKDQRKWYTYFDPYITSAGHTGNDDNREVMFGCAEAICSLYNMLDKIGIRNPGNRMADAEFDAIIKQLNEIK